MSKKMEEAEGSNEDDAEEANLDLKKELSQIQEIPIPNMSGTAKYSMTVSSNLMCATERAIHHIIDPVEGTAHTCLLCGMVYRDIYALQAHVLTQTHPEEWTIEHQNNPTYTCIRCFAEINPKTCEGHRCAIETRDRIVGMIQKLNTTCGPLTCLSCRGRSFPSRVHLQIHIITAHSHHSQPFSCSVCGTHMRTKDTYVHELHAYAIHVPELAIRTRKVLANALKVQADPSKPFLCLHPNQIYDNKKNKRKCCALNFNSVVDYTAHLICYHSSFFMPSLDYREECRSCLLGFNDEFTFKQHVQERHIPEYTRRVRNLTEKKKLQQQINPSKTCFECWTVFNDALSMQVHCFVTHATESWRVCGLCKTQFTDEEDSLAHTILWRSIQSHEARHVRHIRCQTLRKAGCVTVPMGRPAPVLFTDQYIPGAYKNEAVMERDESANILTSEQRKFFTALGEKNTIAQDELEDDFK